MIFFLFCLPIWAQEQFKLSGQYNLGASKAVSYSMTWSEQGERLEGTYQDDYFKEQGKVSGIKNEAGRNFYVTFPTEKRGVKSINLSSSLAGAGSTATTIPVCLFYY